MSAITALRQTDARTSHRADIQAGVLRRAQRMRRDRVRNVRRVLSILRGKTGSQESEGGLDEVDRNRDHII